MTLTPRITLVTEAYNLAEGQSETSFLRALNAVAEIAARRPDVEVVVLDPSPGNLAKPILANHFPQFTASAVPGLSYDGQKNLAARQGNGELLVFLDGDCTPFRQNWLETIIEPLMLPQVHGVGGLTLYDDFSVTGKAMSILDFGFLFDAPEGVILGCYASNNVAFRRDTYLRFPAPDEGLLRSYCYKHAQLMQRSGVPVRSNPRAFVLHELPEIEKERMRRGYDYVAALWADPMLPLAGELENTPAFVERVLRENYGYACSRMAAAPHVLGITSEDHPHLIAEIRRLMSIDARGLQEALVQGNADGRNGETRKIHHSLKQAPSTLPH